ncbi:MAG TPA: HD domain-containing protein [Candidatus Wujingus californicus]|uniref:HD domain-containing protein n=1 Tax=Candidatus Wujingus californicus TaxID=3367618 RepID=UPI004029F838
MESKLREHLKKFDQSLYETFIDLVNSISPLLDSIKDIFPEFTRHDNYHNLKLEEIAFDILAPKILEKLSPSDIFTLLSSLWIHDAGMGNDLEIKDTYKGFPEYLSKLKNYERIGLSEEVCWRNFVRENHHRFCEVITRRLLKNKVSNELIYWISLISASHGEQNLHDRTIWHKIYAISDSQYIHPPVIAVFIRLADILHFNRDRAPEYMQEHRNISNSDNIMHWRAHQVSSDYTIQDDICYIDGVTEDDEAYWFAQQFIEAMDDELNYCKQMVFPILETEFQSPLLFSRVHNRIKSSSFFIDLSPVTLKVETSKFLEDLLNDSLYANKPIWFREVVQNAFDACRDLVFLKKEANPSVIIRFNSSEGEIEFEDFGIGMKKETVENYLLVAGASYWSSNEYKGSRDIKPGHVGKFGIGFMSLFSIASHITVLTRYVEDDQAWCFNIRNSKRVVRVEKCNRNNSGTLIKIKLKIEKIFSFDVLSLFDDICIFPEFPIKLIFDDVTERNIENRIIPRIETSDINLEPKNAKTDAKLLKENIDEKNMVGDYYLPKIYIKSLSSFVPVLPRYLFGAGWNFIKNSNIYFGGIKYPPLHSLDREIGFTSIPSIGCFRLFVSPNEYSLEMNLSREQFITGESTRQFLYSVCNILDKIISNDLEEELSGKEDPFLRSTIAALYSNALMNIWTGQVHDLNYVYCVSSIKTNKVLESPWPNLTNIMMRELKFGCIDILEKLSFYSINDLLNTKSLVFAIGSNKGTFSRELIKLLFSYDKSAKLLAILPEPDFGIQELRHWAVEEVLVPIPSHSRCAFGLKFDKYNYPFQHYPREADHLGLPVASGPAELALLDYRRFMAESKSVPTGGTSDIVGVLNRNNNKVKKLLSVIKEFKSPQNIYKIYGKNFHNLRNSLKLGTLCKYKNFNRKLLAEELNNFLRILRKNFREIVELDYFNETDFPHYFDGGESKPFGRFGITDIVKESFMELSNYQDKGLDLSHLT